MLLPLLVASSLLSADPSAPPLVPSEVAPPPLVESVSAEPVKKPRSPKRALTIAGTAVFGVSYGLSLGTAAIMEMAARSLPVVPSQSSAATGLFVPLVGPIIAAANPRNQTSPTAPLLVIDGLAQVAGLAMLIIGIALPEPVAPAAPTVWLVPTGGANGVGAAFGARF
jgi:hypothetical protein